MYYKDITLTGPQAAIGYEDENLPTRVIIDISDLTKYGPGTTVLEVKRPCDREAYIAEQTEVDGNNFYWYPTKGDLEVSGLLKCQVKAVIGDQIVKTRVYSVQVSGALNGDGTLSGVVPDALQTFVESASGSEDAAKASAEEALKSTPPTRAGTDHIRPGQHILKNLYRLHLFLLFASRCCAALIYPAASLSASILRLRAFFSFAIAVCQSLYAVHSPWQFTCLRPHPLHGQSLSDITIASSSHDPHNSVLPQT